MKSQSFRRILSLVLVVVMISGLAGFSAFADENDALFFAVLSGQEHETLRSLLCALIDGHGLSVMPVS